MWETGWWEDGNTKALCYGKEKEKNTKTCVCIDAWDSVANYRAAKGMSLGVLPDLRKKIPLALLHACLFFTTPRCIWNFLHV